MTLYQYHLNRPFTTSELLLMKLKYSLITIKMLSCQLITAVRVRLNRCRMQMFRESYNSHYIQWQSLRWIRNHPRLFSQSLTRGSWRSWEIHPSLISVVKVGDRKMLSAGLVIMLVMSLLLVITCHACQARRLSVKKWPRSDDDCYSQSV